MAKLTSFPSRLWLTASSTTPLPIRRRRYPWLSSPKPCTRRCARAFHKAYLQFPMRGIRMTTGSLMAPGFPPGRLQLNRLTPQRHHRFLAITTPHQCCDVQRRRSRTQRTSPLRTSRLRASRLRASPRRRLRPHRPQSLLEQQPVRRLPPVRSLLPKIKTIPSCAEAFRREPLSRKKSRLLLTNRLLLLQRRNLLARRALFS